MHIDMDMAVQFYGYIQDTAPTRAEQPGNKNMTTMMKSYQNSFKA